MLRSDKSIEMPKFDGKNYQRWWVKFRAFSVSKDVYSALTKNPDLPATDGEEFDVTTDDGKKKELARVKNNLAMAYLLNSFKQDRTTLGRAG